MPIQAFNSPAENDFLSQPNSSGEKLILRSSSASDNTQTATLGGVDSGSTPRTEALALAGQTEIETTYAFKDLTSLSVSAALLGSLHLFTPGAAGSGDVTVGSIPANGDELNLGLSGSASTYTFVAPAFRLLTCPDQTGNIAAGEYFDVTLDGSLFRVWYDVDASGASAPASGGGTLVKVDITSGDSGSTVASLTATALDAAISGWTSVANAAELRCVKDALGSGTSAFTDTGTTGVVNANSGSGTAAAANQIRTTYAEDATDATATLVAGYVEAAIEAGSGSGTAYSAATTAHPTLTASAASTVVTLTDRLAVARALGWTVTTDSVGLTPRTITGGADGALLALLTGTDVIQVAMSLYTPDVSEATLIANTTPTFAAVYLSGRPAQMHIRAPILASPVSMRLEVSDDGEEWADRSAGYPIAAIDNNEQWIELPPFEYVRLVVSANANTVDVEVHAVVIFS